MNSNCTSCDVEKQCGYQYKPCDCCNYRKFKPLETPAATQGDGATVFQFPIKAARGGANA